MFVVCLFVSCRWFPTVSIVGDGSPSCYVLFFTVCLFSFGLFLFVVCLFLVRGSPLSVLLLACLFIVRGLFLVYVGDGSPSCCVDLAILCMFCLLLGLLVVVVCWLVAVTRRVVG